MPQESYMADHYHMSGCSTWDGSSKTDSGVPATTSHNTTQPSASPEASLHTPACVTGLCNWVLGSGCRI